LQHLINLLVSYLPLIVVVLPLLSTVAAGLGHKQRPWYGLDTWLLALAMLLGGYLLVLTYQGILWYRAFTWLHIPGSPFALVLSWHMDFTVAVMVSLTTIVNFFTHLYALAYMQTDRRRYLVLVGNFVSAMLGFLMAENLIARFIGWELIGLGSYLLINFWYHQETAARSGTRVWLINHMGSMSLLIGILIVGSELGSFDLAELAALSKDTDGSNGWLVVAECCLLGGVCAKSAQFPWFSWLPNAMTAPTPASALIHSATMVGAGVYLLIGLVPILGTATLTWIAYLGSFTAFMGACAALTQRHIKRVLVYSTISQLGYTVMAVGVGASGAGLFHFVIHAFCKACLFLCVGVVSRFLLQLGKGNNMQRMGGLRKTLPSTFCAYLIAASSLIGIPGLAGSLSKEAILTYTLSWAHQQTLTGSFWGYLVPVLGFCSSFLGIAYMGRQCCLVFMGTPRWLYKLPPGMPYRAPLSMQIGMFALALCSLGCWYGPLAGNIQDSWLLQRLTHAHLLVSTVPVTATLQHRVTLASAIIMALGILFLVIWKRKSPATFLLPRTRLLLHGWYLGGLANIVARRVLHLSSLAAQWDQQISGWLYGIGVGYIMLGNLFKWLDQKLLEFVVSLIISVPRYVGKAHRTIQQGNLQYTLLWMVASTGLLFLGIYWLTRGV
jgi:NADH-quinone oxidoreductase subunit L